ncbi:hypothetical protein V8F06_011473 [Rhypophila decipiens]
MTEQNGIDILCDAAGSDLLLSSLFSRGPRPEGGQQPLHAEEQARVKRAKTDATTSSSVAGGSVNGNSVSSETVISGPAASGSNQHVCHLCKKVYERADHLTRHMRSHENARQYQCSRCQKRFNRADLLTRHETTHDRDTNGKGRVIIRLRDRAAEACLNCAASKAKCDDQKPCSRCRNKGLPCETTPKRTLQDRQPSIVNPTPSPSFKDATGATPDMRSGSYAMPNSYEFAHESHSASKSASHAGVAITNQNDVMLHQSMMDGIPNELIYFNGVHNFFPDVDFTSWDLNFEGFPVPPFDSSHGTSPHSSVNTATKSANRAYKDSARRHAAFKKSPWLWEPDQTDYVRRDTEGLQLNEDAFSHSLPLERSLGRPTNKLKLTTATRDRLFAIVLSTIKDPIRVPSFPSLDLLNYLLHIHFLNDEYQYDSWIHSASFSPDEALPEKLAAIIAHGASFISVPSVWQFGLALQEIVRQRIGMLFEADNSNTRRLECLQAYLQNLDVGIWSGFKRKTELAESFLQPLVTILRRLGVLIAPPDSPSTIPLASDSPEALEAKWHQFILRESYKRLVLHAFFHDVQTSISLQKNVLLSFTELSFCLPASRDLWKSPSPQAWRDNYLAKQYVVPIDRAVPRLTDAMHRLDLLDSYSEVIDLDLCHMAILHGFWGQIAAYREGIKFYCHHDSGMDGGMNLGNSQRDSARRHLLRSQHQELYRDLSEFSTVIYTTRKPPAANLAIIAELLMMILHVSLDDLQKFAGKAGEEEARRAAVAFEEDWAHTADARYAVWHAGQVLYNARRLPPTSLKGFYAMAVYFATLTLWMYGLLACSRSGHSFGDHQQHQQQQQHPFHHRGSFMSDHGQVDPSSATPMSLSSPSALSLVVLDSEETRDTRAFLQLNRGVPGLTVTRDIQQQHQHQQHGQNQQHHEANGRVGVEALSNPGMALAVGRNLFRDNFPVSSEPLPPLVESLVNLLRDLGSGPAGRASRAASESSQG